MDRLTTWLLTILVLLCGMGNHASAKALYTENIASGGLGQSGWESTWGLGPQTLETQWENEQFPAWIASVVCYGPNVYTYVAQNPWTMFDPEGLSAWGDFTGYWKGVGNGVGNMAKGAAAMAWNIHPFVNAGQLATGNKTGYQKNFESGIATAKAGYNLATSSQARSEAVSSVGNHLQAAWNEPEKAGELAFNFVTTAVTLGEGGVALASKLKTGTSIATTSARATGAAAKVEVAAAEGSGLVANSVTTPVGALRAGKLKDAHHVIQDAAVRDLPGYNTNAAPGIRLDGPANVPGTPHNLTRPVQRQAGGGNYAAERRIGYKALRKAGVATGDARQAISESDGYFQGIGVTRSTPTRIPRDRR